VYGLRTTPIAIIGAASIFAESHDVVEYWDNILKKIDCITEVPPSRWRVDDYYDPDPAARDKVYCKRGGFLPDIDFNLTHIVIGPQGVCEEAVATGTHQTTWLDREPTGDRVTWRVVIFFPWDADAKLFTGERVYTFFPDSEDLG